jgi:hypothetical protein
VMRRDRTPRVSSRIARLAILVVLPIAALISARRTSAQPARAPRTLDVSFVCNACGLDTGDVRKAVLAETGAAAGPFAQGAAQLSLRVDKRRLTARYEAPDRRVLERQVELPKDPSRAVQAIALLAANLARDEAADLLEHLRPVPAASSASSAPSSNTSPSSAPPAIATSSSAAPSASTHAPSTLSIVPAPVQGAQPSTPQER